MATKVLQLTEFTVEGHVAYARSSEFSRDGLQLIFQGDYMMNFDVVDGSLVAYIDQGDALYVHFESTKSGSISSIHVHGDSNIDVTETYSTPITSTDTAVVLKRNNRDEQIQVTIDLAEISGNGYTATYMVNGEVYATKQYFYREILDPLNVSVPGYTFVSWTPSITSSRKMPAQDYTFTATMQVNSYTVTYLLDGETYATESHEYGSTVSVLADPTAPSGKTFSGWSRSGSFVMPAEPVTITGSMQDSHVEPVDPSGDAEPIDHSWIEVEKIPVLREKLYDSVSGETRPGNRLEIKMSAKLKVLDEDDKEIYIRRIIAVLPNGNEQETVYYIKVDPDAEADDKVVKDTWLRVNTSDTSVLNYVYYAAQIHDSGKFTVDVCTLAEEEPDDYYNLLDWVKMTPEEKFYEYVQDASDNVIQGAELFVDSKSRPYYDVYVDGHPDMVDVSDGDPYTSWMQDWHLSNDHNHAVYSEVLKLDDLEQIKVNQVIYDEKIPYTVDVSDDIYPYTYYPKGDFWLIDQDGIESAAETLEKQGFTNAGAALFGDTLNVYYVSDADASSYAAVYIMDSSDRIGMVIGYPGDEVELPDNLKKLGYNFKGYEAPVPTVFTASPQTVNTIWEKIDDGTADSSVQKHKATWTVPGKNWSYSISVEVGAHVPAAPNPAIENISITSWTLKSEPFENNEMPDYDILYEAVYTETTPAQTPKHNLVYQIQYTTENSSVHTDTYKTYQIAEGAAITPEPAPYKRGGTFQGWTNLPAYMPDHDVTVTGTFSGLVKNSITITYYVDGVVHTTQTYTPGDTVTAPQNPTQSGKVFSGWIGVPNVAPSYNMEVQGYFYDDNSDLVTIKYVVDGQSYKTYRLQKGAVLPTEPAPVKTGYTFSGWTPVLTIVPNQDTTITGTFTADQPEAVKYDLKFYLTDEDLHNPQLYAQYKLAAGEVISAPTCDVPGFEAWLNVPQVMPAQNLDIYGPVSSTLDFAVNCVYEYTNADKTKTNVRGISYLIAAGAQFVYPNHNPDQAHADYIWKGWTGDSAVINNIMPAAEVNLVGHFVAPEINDEPVDGYARIEWRLPNYDPNGLNHDPYDVYKAEYVPFGTALVAPQNVPNYTALDGFEYQFSSWGTYPATAPSSTQTVKINATSTRVSKQYDVKYYLYRYELGAADAVKFLYKTKKVTPGTSMSTVHAEVAADIPTDWPGYLWKGIWYEQTYNADSATMGWGNREYYSHIYSPEYAEQTGVTVSGYHKVQYLTRSYSPGLAPDYTPYVDSVAIYTVAATQWVAEGATFTDPQGPFTAPFPNGSKFAFAGWEEHSNVMGTSDITVWATWQYVTYPCEITWTIKTIDENGQETQEVYAVTTQQQGFALQWPDDPVAPENYVWAGWDVATYPGMTTLVWREPVHVVYGKMVHVNSGECPDGFAYAKYLLKTHDTKYPPTRYYTHATIIAPCGGPIPGTSVPADWTGLDGNIYRFISWQYPQSTMPQYTGRVLEIVAQDAWIATEKNFTMELWMQGNGHNEKETWATLEVLPGTNLEQTVIDYIAEHGEPSKTNFVWSGIWRCDYQEMPNFDCKATTVMWDYDYYIEVHPESDEYFTIEWVSPYWTGYWRPQDRWTIKTEVVKQGTVIVPPEDPEMTGGHASEYRFIGWTGLPENNVMPRRNLTITANWEETTVTAYAIWNMAVPQQNGTVVYTEYFRREIDMSTARYTGAETAVGAWPSNPASDYQKEFVQWCQPYSGVQVPSQWTPMAPADDYSIYYNPDNQTQEYLIGTALMKSLEWDNGKVTGYSRVYWNIPSMIKHHTGYNEYEWTTWKFFYVKNGYAISTPTGTPPNVFDYEGYANEFIEWPSHPTVADGTDIEINAVYDRAAVRYTIRYYGIYYDRTGVNTAVPSTKLLLTCRAFGGAFIDILPKKDPKDWEFHYNRRNIPVGSHFWGVINDSSGAPLYATWDGTCLWRNMDLAAELWLTGDEQTADYVPEESVDLVEWPDGDDMDHDEHQYSTVTCTYMIDGQTFRVRTYSDGTRFYNLKADDINEYLAEHGHPDKVYSYWDGAPESGIVYVEDYPTRAFTVTLVYVDKVGAPVIRIEPAARTLTYTGWPQELVTAGVAVDGELQYSLSQNGEYSTSIPTGTDAGSYTVWYKAIAINPVYNDTNPQSVNCSIGTAAFVIDTLPTAKTGLVYTGSPLELVNQGHVTGATIMYNMTNSNPDATNWTTGIPVQTDAGEYTVYYKFVADSNHTQDDTVYTLSCTIEKARATVEAHPRTDIVYHEYTFNRAFPVSSSQITVTGASYVSASVDCSTWTNGYYDEEEDIMAVFNVYDSDSIAAINRSMALLPIDSSLGNIPGSYDIYFKPQSPDSNHYVDDTCIITAQTVVNRQEIKIIDIDIHVYDGGMTVFDDPNHRTKQFWINQPNPASLTYTGDAQALIDVSATNQEYPWQDNSPIVYEYLYSDSQNGPFSNVSPTATNAGTHAVYFKLHVLESRCWTGDETSVHSIQCSISPAPLREWAFKVNYNLTYNGNQQELITLKNSETAPNLNVKYNLMFSYDNSTWSYNTPVATNAGDHSFWVKAVAIDGNYTPDLMDDSIGTNHITTTPVQYTVTVKKASLIGTGFIVPEMTGTQVRTNFGGGYENHPMWVYDGGNQIQACTAGGWDGTPKGRFEYALITKRHIDFDDYTYSLNPVASFYNMLKPDGTEQWSSTIPTVSEHSNYYGPRGWTSSSQPTTGYNDVTFYAVVWRIISTDSNYEDLTSSTLPSRYRWTYQMIGSEGNPWYGHLVVNI